MQPLISAQAYALALLAVFAGIAMLCALGLARPLLRRLYRMTLGRAMDALGARMARRRAAQLMGWRRGWSR